MARTRKELEPPKPWEALGVFFGYFAVAKDAPFILRTLGFPKYIPSCLKDFLLRLNKSPDFWLLLLFTIFTLILYFWFLPRRREQEEPENLANDNRANVDAILRKERLLRVIRSFGIVLLREKMLDWMNVDLYGTFHKTSNWAPEPSRFNYVDRINYTDGAGIEFQYSKDFREVFVRTHPTNNITYGEPAIRMPNAKDVRLLLVASNYFPFWFLVHSIMRIGRCLKNAKFS